MVKLYSKDYATLHGTINTLTEALVEEERNGLFELRFIMLNTDSLFSCIEKENIVVANANDTLLNQKFRIYNIRKLMSNRVEVYARHISFDLMYDYIDSFQCTNQSCQYVLNQLFLNSNFSKHYKGYSDIVNAQNYNVSNSNILSAIGGSNGSVLDTFGKGAELLRDNEKISVLNRRGNDNLVTIEYKKNLTGFELEEDTTDLVTRILPYAKYTPKDAEGNTLDEVIVKANYVDSPLINNYSHPYIRSIDYSDEFKEDEVPTVEKLITFAHREYNINKVDISKQNFKIDFIPLSKCVGYDGLNDKINICDTVTIIDTRYNINTKAKVIKTVFNVIKNRYESIELGEPRTSLGDVIGNGNEPSKGDKGDKGDKGEPGKDGNLGDFPDSLPIVPVLESFVYGFSNIELTWSFENKVYYSYEVYASKTKGFTPNAFDLIFEGQASSYMFQAQPSETWYFRVCGINTYGNRTTFSNEVEVVTTKISDLSNYVENMAIGEALIGKLSLDRGWIGKLNANLLDVKGNFSVTDGNGARTFDIDSFGNVNIQASTLRVTGKDVATQTYANTVASNAASNAVNNQTQYDIYNKLTNGGQTQGIYLYNNRLYLNAEYIGAGTLQVDRISSNNSNPIIRLFGNCALDATASYNQGQGNAIRLKWDDSNYIYISSGSIQMYQNGVQIFTFKNPGAFNSDIGTQNGTLRFTGNALYFIDTNGYGKWVSMDGHTHSGYASYYHSHDYMPTDSSQYLVCGGVDPYYSNSYNLGWSQARWQQVSAKYGYFDYATGGSDVRIKDNILPIVNPNIPLLARMQTDNISETDMYNFVRDNLNLYSYKYTTGKDETCLDNQIGFIANELYDTEVGKKFIYQKEDDVTLSYSLGGYTTVLAGALKEEIRQRELLENRVAELEKQIQILLNASN